MSQLMRLGLWGGSFMLLGYRRGEVGKRDLGRGRGRGRVGRVGRVRVYRRIYSQCPFRDWNVIVIVILMKKGIRSFR